MMHALLVYFVDSQSNAIFFTNRPVFIFGNPNTPCIFISSLDVNNCSAASSGLIDVGFGNIFEILRYVTITAFHFFAYTRRC